MRDPLSWSVPLGTIFGITIRVHVLFPVVVLGLILRVAFGKDYEENLWITVCGVMGLLFASVLLHEFGHCFGARLMDGDAHEILMWPLGGLAYVEVPHTPRANFVATAAGPLVNILLCLAAGGILTYYQLRPPFEPWWDVYRGGDALYHWGGAQAEMPVRWLLWVARFFWLNWFLALLNLLLIGFPLDGGRLFQCALWPRFGFRQATLAASVVGIVVAILVGIFAIVTKYYDNAVLALFLALFIFYTCRQQWLILEQGGEDSVFGYDFSQGYTSLERDQPPSPRRRRPNVWQRWWQRRAQKKQQRQAEQREAEERRMDELLEKVQREGLQALTDEERRFLTRVSHKYRNRQ